MLFNVLMLSPALVPLGALAVAPVGTQGVVQRADAWMREHQKALITAVAGAIGAYLTAKGLVAL